MECGRTLTEVEYPTLDDVMTVTWVVGTFSVVCSPKVMTVVSA